MDQPRDNNEGIQSSETFKEVVEVNGGRSEDNEDSLTRVDCLKIQNQNKQRSSSMNQPA